MSFLQVLVLAVVQGVTEFFPVSSSAHLILTRHFLGWSDSGLFLDVAVHAGTLGAIMVYFAHDVKRLIKGIGDVGRLRKTSDSNFFLTLSFATLPVVGIGFCVDQMAGNALRTLEGLGWTSLVFGALLYSVDRFSRADKPLTIPSWKEAFWGWGLAQALALIHGASRSGICMTFGRFKGYERVAVARFAFLMAIPTLGAAATLKTIQFYIAGEWDLLGPALMGVVISFITGLGALRLLMLWLRSFSFAPFVVYRMILGIFLLALAYS